MTAVAEIDVTTLRGRRTVTRVGRLSMGDVFERIRWSRPNATVLTAFAGAAENPDRDRLTAAEADGLANRFANGVLAAGISPGDVVLMACENSVEALLVKIGLAKAGVVAAPVNPRLTPDVVAELLQLTGARSAVLDTEFWPAFAGPLADAGTTVLAAIAIGDASMSTNPPAPSFSQFVAEQPDTEPDIEIHADDIWQILFTSGTSATPKAVLIPHIKTVLEAMSMTGTLVRGLRFEHDLVMGGFLPMIYHVGDITLWSAILAGGSAVVGRRADPVRLAEAVDRHAITGIWAGSPQIVQGLDRALRDHPTLNGSSITSIVFGFAPLLPSAYRSLRKTLGDNVACLEIIGQTEICCCHRFFLGEHTELFEREVPKLNYVGLPHALMAATIVAADGTPLPIDSSDVGEMVYRSPALTPGYFRNPEATAEAMRGGWFHGGDAFRTGEGGQRVLVDRFKDIVKTGGENVSSIRVEQTLLQHDSVQRAAVVGLPHHRWGEAVTAMVTLEQPCDPRDLIEHCRERLAGFEVPKQVLVIEQFPEAVGGKIRKNVLRERYAELYRIDPATGRHVHGPRCYWDHTQARWVCDLVSTVTPW